MPFDKPRADTCHMRSGLEKQMLSSETKDKKKEIHLGKGKIR
jgi:hypothetical protein